MDISVAIDNILDDKDKREEIISNFLQIMVGQSDEKKLTEFYEKIYTLYEHDIMDYVSELIVGGAY